MPVYQIVINMFLNYEMELPKEILTNLTQMSIELRQMPLPYGLLPHELLEIIDNDRILPGVSKIYKMAEDFPYLNHYEFNASEVAE